MTEENREIVKRHVILGRELHRDYLKGVEQRLAGIRKERAGGRGQIDQKVKASRANALKEFEQASSENSLLGGLLGQLGFGDALNAPATVSYQQHPGRNEEIGALLNFAV